MGDEGGTVTLPRARVLPGEAPAPQLVVLLSCEQPLERSTRHLLADVDRVVVGRGERDAASARAGGQRVLTLRLPDRGLSSTHASLQRLHGRWLLEDLGSKNGTRVNGASIQRGVLADGDLIEIGGTFLIFRDAVAVAEGEGGRMLETFHGPLAAALEAAAAVASSTLPILILGATGTGKEVVARALHALSRRSGNFVAVNCAALPASLAEASLFGHRRGAFTGAVDDRRGFVTAAAGGTLFLDEIADLPASSQGALLRFLQEGEVVAVGDTRAVTVDTRVLAATHRDLPALARAGKFRDDLLARLAGLLVHLPPLAERREDLGLLIAALLARLAPRASLHPEAAAALLRHDWPHNVRELELALRAAAVLAGGGAIDASHLPAAVRRPRAAALPEAEAPLSERDRALREAFVGHLREHQGNVAAVARVMGKGRMQIHRWLKRYALDLDAYRK